MQVNLNDQQDEMVAPTLLSVTNKLGFKGTFQKTQIFEWASSSKPTALVIQASSTEFPTSGSFGGASNNTVSFGVTDSSQLNLVPIFPLIMGLDSHLALRRLFWLVRNDPARLKAAQETAEAIDPNKLTQEQTDRFLKHAKPFNELMEMRHLLTASAMLRQEKIPEEFASISENTLSYYVTMVQTQRAKEVYKARISGADALAVKARIPPVQGLIEAAASTYLGMVARWSTTLYPSFGDIEKEDNRYHLAYRRFNRPDLNLDSHVVIKSLMCAASAFMGLAIPKAYHLLPHETEALYHCAYDFLIDAPIAESFQLEEPSVGHHLKVIK